MSSIKPNHKYLRTFKNNQEISLFLKTLKKLLHAEDEKEPEMQIGQPTDVKHVAHIGWEGPSATTPSWVYI